MKDNDDHKLGWVESQYYPALAQYFVKYIQAYGAQGTPINFVSVNNDPTCCATYPSANNVAQQTTVQNQYPGIPMYDTEMSGGTWVGNQHLVAHRGGQPEVDRPLGWYP